MKKERYFTVLGFAIIFLFSISFMSSADSSNETIKNQSLICLNESYTVMHDMSVAGFNVIRVNDSIKQAQLLYNSQQVLFEKKAKYDFSSIIDYCIEIKNIQLNATFARDEFNALLVFYNSSIVEGMNTASIDKILNEIRDEIKNERYEKVKPLVDSAYNEIINVKSSYTALNVFIDSTTRSFARFLKENAIAIIVTILVLAILFFTFRIRILKWILSRKIMYLELRKKTIKELVMKTQKDYFERGTMAEGEYNIKVKKFAELIRDIDRQIPLLREDLIKLEKKKVKKL
jgi:hypothetical protein